MPVLLAAPDKFRGTITARQAAAAIAAAGSTRGWDVRQVPLSDGGEGFLDALGGLGGTRRQVEVEGPLGTAVTAQWLQVGRLAVIEMAQASGLVLAGGAPGNDPWSATTRGTGELIVAAARQLRQPTPPAHPVPPDRSAGPAGGQGDRPMVVVGLGGSATTDGGRGALDVIEEAGGLGDVELVGACDVSVGFVEAARRFGPQKGADAGLIVKLEGRLEKVAGEYRRLYGVNVLTAPGAGAAGGFGGAILALGGSLRSGYTVVTELLAFPEALGASRAVVTGEGSLDASSLMGKVVGSVLEDASARNIPVLIVAGRADNDAVAGAEAAGARVVSLSEEFGEERALADTAACVTRAVRDALWVADGPAATFPATDPFGHSPQ
jgi:glycerate kinase